MKKNIILALVASGLIAGFAVTAMAQEKAKANAADEEKVTSVSNKITGTISNIGKNNFAVVYDRNEATGEEFEMLFPIGKNLRIVHKKSFAELAVGDKVEVQFDDVTTEKKDRKEGKRNTAVLTFIDHGETQADTVANHDNTNTTTESTSVAPLKSDLR